MDDITNLSDIMSWVIDDLGECLREEIKRRSPGLDALHEISIRVNDIEIKGKQIGGKNFCFKFGGKIVEAHQL